MIAKEAVEQAIAKTDSMRAAARYLGVDYKTLRTYAKSFGLFAPNQGGKGNLTRDWSVVPFENLTPVRKRARVLTEANSACELCGFNRTRPDGKSVIQVDHIDGDHQNWSRLNLRALCPNCHAVDSAHFMFYGRKHTNESKVKSGKRKT